MKLRLLWKFTLINVTIVVMVALMIDLAIHFLAADYFMTLSKDYGIAPEKAHRMFLDSVQHYLAFASLAGCGIAFCLSIWWTSRVLKPLTEMTQSAGRIAAGDYSERVAAHGRDEIGDLASAFNRMTESLIHIEQLRKEMVVNVAHELRTPLTNIRGYLEALIDRVMPPSTETFESLHEETLRLVSLVEDLLNLARADAARDNLHTKPIQLAPLIEQTVELFQLKFAEKKLAVALDVAAARLDVAADMDKLRQVLTNLLENAWRYTPTGGRVTVVAQRSPAAITVSFSNDCADIDRADPELIFERFYRAEPSRSRAHGGTGVGLTIVKELIEAHGGKVGSKVSAGQTQIWFSLPL